MRQNMGRVKLKSWLGGLCLAASLGAHGVLLGLPWSPSTHEADDSTAIEEPTASIDVAVLPAPQPEPAPPIPVSPPAEIMRPAAVVPSPRVAPPSPQPTPEVIPAPAPEPLATEPAPPVAAPIAEPEPIAESAPVPEPMAEPAPEPEPQPYANFPHFQGAQQADCGGEACWTSPVEGGWRGAARSIQDNLEAQGYRLSNITGEVLSTETGVRIYRVTKTGEDPYYLNLVSVTEGILYSLTPTPLSEDRLIALQAL